MKDKRELEREQRDLERRLMEVKRELRGKERRGVDSPVSERRPLRELILDGLSEAKAPLNSLLLASVFRPLFGRDVPSTRFGSLSADEQKSFDSQRARPVYLCHCLTHDSGQAMKRFWARSDWPLEDRIIGPMSGRILFLQGAKWVLHVALTMSERAADADKLQFVAADQARDAGLEVQRGKFPYEAWTGEIDAKIERFRGEDIELRARASVELRRQLSERAQLFGAVPPLTSIPGTSRHWNHDSR